MQAFIIDFLLIRVALNNYILLSKFSISHLFFLFIKDFKYYSKKIIKMFYFIVDNSYSIMYYNDISNHYYF